MPTVTIDDKPYEAEVGETILEVAKRAGIWIPTLCYNPALSGYASCRLCLVELDRGDWRQMVTSCNYPVRRDLKVWVNSERAKRARKGVMQLLLARCPESKELRALAEKMGVTETPYPTVTEAQRNCILCGLCTRVCAEVIGQSAISFAGRGVDRAVAAPFRMAPDACIACGACAAICPVGTIQIRRHEGEIEISPFKARVPVPVCRDCGAELVSERVGMRVLQLLMEKYPDADKDTLKDFVTLCPACRRARVADKLSLSGAR